MLLSDRRTLALMAGVVLLGVTACSDSSGPGSDLEEHLLFLSTRSGGLDELGRPARDIYRMEGLDTAAVLNLTGQPAWFYAHMSLSPDGRWLVFASDCEVSVMRTDGAGRTSLAGGPGAGCNGYPRWSPDGSRIAFASNRDGRTWGVYGGLYDVYVMNADGSDQRNVSQELGDALDFNVHVLGWTPAGQIVFQTDGPAEGEWETRIYVVNVDGTGGQPLFDGVDDHSPAWSPDGSQIAFISERDGRRRLYVMNADGTDARPLTNHPGNDHLVTTIGGFSDAQPDISPWSPDGQRIAFTRFHDGSNWGALHVVGADGSGLQRLTDFPTDFNGWSPLGTRIALTRRAIPGPADIYLIDVDGTGLRNLTASPAEDTDAFWVRH
jgi:TolB protein